MIDELRAIAKELKLLKQPEAVDKVLCAIAALTDTENPRADLSYTYVMRKLRKEDPEQQAIFQKTFKDTFEKALDEDEEDPAQIALMEALNHIDEVE